MRPYVIRQGDFLAQLAERFGFDATEVWEHSANAALRELRDSPNVLAPGDVVQIPEPAEEPRVRIQPRATNRYCGRIGSVPIRLVVRHEGEVLRNAACKLVSLTPPRDATTDGDGVLSVDVPHQLTELRVRFPAQDLELLLRLGHLDPISESSGVLGRLENLGFLLPTSMMASTRDDLGSEAARAARLRRAVALFQHSRDLEPTGELDDQTRDALREAHGA